MENVFLKIFNMSITASYLIIAILLVRMIIKKAPKKYSCILWALVGVRLILPFSIESRLSLIPSVNTVPRDIMYSQTPSVNTGIPTVNNTLNSLISNSFSPNPTESVNPMQIVSYIAAFVWILGMGAIIIYAFISYFRVYKNTRESLETDSNVYICDRIDTPFVLGLLKPKIYIPSSMNENDLKYVLAHERAHIKRFDHIWKILGFTLFTVYWFNPLVICAYALLCKDIELACDEKVVGELGEEIKKEYSEALINCSSENHIITACPLAFGEVSVKSRIKSILNYKKPAFWIAIVSVALIIALALGFMLDPLGIEENSAYTLYNGYTKSVLVSHMQSEDKGLGIEHIYMSSDYKLYIKDENGENKLLGKMKNTERDNVPGINELVGGYCIAAWRITKNSYFLSYIALMNDNSLLAIYKDNGADDYMIYSMSPDLYSGTLNPEASKADFFGIVLSVEEDYIVVCPGMGEGIGGLDEYIQLGEKVKINTKTKTGNTLPQVNVGDKISIVYDGNPSRGDIPYIENVYSISMLEIK